MELLLDSRTILMTLIELSSDSRIVWLGLLFGIIYIRSMIRSEKTITHIEDMAVLEEDEKLTKRIADKLSVIESELYEAMEQYVYSDKLPQRRISIVRTFSRVNIPAKDYLRDYHGASKTALFKVILPLIEDELRANFVSVSSPSEEITERTAKEIRQRIVNEIRKKAGSNNDIRNIEDSILTYESIIDMYINISTYSQHLRARRDEYVDTETKKHRMPLIPKWHSLTKKR